MTQALPLQQDAVGDRVTVVLQNDEAVRVALPFTPVGPLPKLALDALQHVLPSGLFHSLATKHLLLPGDVSSESLCIVPVMAQYVRQHILLCRGQEYLTEIDQVL